MTTLKTIADLNDLDINAILAGLRLLQEAVSVGRMSPDIQTIYRTAGGRSLSVGAIDALCEHINFGDAPAPARVFVTVEGGVAEINTEGNVTVRLRDYDVDGDDSVVKDVDGNACAESFHGVENPKMERGQ